MSASLFLQDEFIQPHSDKNLPKVVDPLPVDLGDSPTYSNHVDIARISAFEKTLSGAPSYTVDEMILISNYLLGIQIASDYRKEEIVKIMLAPQNKRKIEYNNLLLVKEQIRKREFTKSMSSAAPRKSIVTQPNSRTSSVRGGASAGGSVSRGASAGGSSARGASASVSSTRGGSVSARGGSSTRAASRGGSVSRGASASSGTVSRGGGSTRGTSSGNSTRGASVSARGVSSASSSRGGGSTRGGSSGNSSRGGGSSGNSSRGGGSTRGGR